MAVKTNKVDTNLVLRFKIGLDKNGKDKMKNITLSKINTEATDEDLMVIADAVKKVLMFQVESVIKEDQTVILNA